MSNTSELNYAKNELQQIINEMEEISDGISRDFKGIGNEFCSQSIRSVSNDCRSFKKKLSQVDITDVKAEMVPAGTLVKQKHNTRY